MKEECNIPRDCLVFDEKSKYGLLASTTTQQKLQLRVDKIDLIFLWKFLIYQSLTSGPIRLYKRKFRSTSPENLVCLFFLFLSRTSSKSETLEVGSYPTKRTPVHCLHFTLRNLLLASGPFTPIS